MRLMTNRGLRKLYHKSFTTGYQLGYAHAQRKAVVMSPKAWQEAEDILARRQDN